MCLGNGYSRQFASVFTRPAFALLAVGAFFLQLSQGLALTKEVKQLVDWETQANAIALRSNRVIDIKHYEIPLKLLGKDFSEKLPAEVRQALIFERDGKEYVRWIINPEDTVWHKDLEDWLRQKRVSAKKKHYFKGYLTASRSMIIEDPANGAQFSAKVSTNRTGGQWRDKKQDASDARQIRMADDYILDIQKKRGFQHFLYLDEPAMLAVKDIDQAMVIRSLGDLPKGGKYYLPGFSALHDEWGRKIAAINGSKNPADFWNQNYNKPLARALAELAATTGMTYDSPHSQNFLIELDNAMKPTGRIVMRDLGDSYLSKEYFEAMGNSEFLKNWEKGNILKGRMSVSVGTMDGNNYPSWLTDQIYRKWGKEFFEEFDRVFSELTEIPLQELKKAPVSQRGRYFAKSYRSERPGYQRFLVFASCLQGKPFATDGTPCPERFASPKPKVPTRVGAGCVRHSLLEML